MEFPHLGERCSWSSCKIIDFLSLTCGHCKQIFCKEHINQDLHECESYKREISNQSDIKSYVCSSKGCSSYAPIEMLCQKCQKHFCINHRYHDCFDVVEDIETKKQNWNKPDKQFAESIKNINNSINDKLKKAVQKPSKQETALKIQLMRLKGKAEGCKNIPTINRIYFLILYSKCSIKAFKPVFINKDWSIGKVIDSVSSICKVINKNNEPKAPKLRLFKTSNGSQISHDMGVKIADLITKSEIKNGETLILEYVEPNEDLNIFALSDVNEYKDLF